MQSPASSAAHRLRPHGKWHAALTAAVLAALAGMLLVWHYPLGPTWAVCGFVIAAGLVGAYPAAWLVMVPALLPVIGLAPWTGWITFEEFDMLVLAAAVGGYGRLAWIGAPATQRGAAARLSPSALWRIVIALFLASSILAMLRGFADAGGFEFGWFQGYHEPMNSVRLGKSFLLALLLLPLWRQAERQQASSAAGLLSLGLMLGLAGATAATLWERMAFTDLLNFSADYRTTAMFWEMHVGGAALDGFLALTMPFAVRELLVASSAGRWSLSAMVLLSAVYACLVTFSRGVYLAVPCGAVIFFGLHALQQKRAAVAGRQTRGPAGKNPGLLAGALLIALFATFAGWMFQSSGYRGAGLLLGAVALLLPLAQVLQTMPPHHWIAGGVAGLLLVGFLSGIAWLVPKGAYVAYALAFVFTGAMLAAGLRKKGATSLTGPMAFAGFLATLAAVVLVANHWGYSQAVGPATAAAVGCILLALLAGTGRRTLWPDSLRWQAIVACLMGLAIAAIGVFGGGAYMAERFSTGSGDLQGRIKHWQLVVGMLQTPGDWWLGKGLGRFPANDFLVGDPTHHPGDYRLVREGDNSYLKLTGGLNGSDELLRVTQRITAPEKPARVHALIRTNSNLTVHFEVCEKHLLYSAGCLSGSTSVKAAPDKWQALNVELRGGEVSRGLWYAPRLLAFSVAIDNCGCLADLDQLQLNGPDGRELLVNGDFAVDMAHWFFSSDRHHLPWHAKNLFMHVLFDQGMVGVALWGLLLSGALLRLALGKASVHPLAPALAASLAGFTLVGLFDSLLDVPRVATLFYALLLVGLTIGGPASKVYAHAIKETR